MIALVVMAVFVVGIFVIPDDPKLLLTLVIFSVALALVFYFRDHEHVVFRDIGSWIFRSVFLGIVMLLLTQLLGGGEAHGLSLKVGAFVTVTIAFLTMN